MNFKKKNIIVGLSGGVDSSVTAILLKTLNYNISCIYMKNWDKLKKHTKCSYYDYIKDVQSLCLNFKFKLYIMNFTYEYNKFVFQPLIQGYTLGVTPNPDIICNKKIKFHFLKKCAQKLKISRFSTGHYVSLTRINKTTIITIPNDKIKDQTYFLNTLQKKYLKNTLFPLSNYYKKQIRRLAFFLRIKNSIKKDSTGICFIEPKKFRQFLQNYIKIKKGNILLRDKTIVGHHDGIMFYTIGQRISIKNHNRTSSMTHYVVKKKINKNELIITDKKNKKILYKSCLIINKTNWVFQKKNIGILYVNGKLRNQQKPSACIIFNYKKKKICKFNNPQIAITKGQIFVIYTSKLCIGSGTIA